MDHIINGPVMLSIMIHLKTIFTQEIPSRYPLEIFINRSYLSLYIQVEGGENVA